MHSSTQLRVAEDGRVPELDGIRGVAVAMVLIWHYFDCQCREFQPDTWTSNFKVISSQFWSGVDLFFVLSGYLIGGILLKNYQRQNFLKVFFIRRACRILPVYIILLAAYFVCRKLFDTPDFNWLFSAEIPDWTFFFFLQNIWMGFADNWGANFVAVTWSLAVEEQFYVAMPILFLLAGAHRGLVLSVIGILLAPIIRMFAGSGLASYANMPCRMDALLLGVCLAGALRSKDIRRLVDEHRGILACAPVCLVCLIGLNKIHQCLGVLEKTVFGVLYVTTILAALANQGRPITAVLRIRPLAWLGTYSYGIYMYHQAIAGLIHGSIRGTSPSIDTFDGSLLTLLCLIITLIAAFVSYRLLERPFLSFGRNWRFEETETESKSNRIATV